MTPVDPGSASSAVPPAASGPSDADLLDVIRGRPADAESAAAFGALYDRHVDSARALARQLARSPADAEDLTSAAFARLLEVLRTGGGPTEAFRAYLLTSLRHLAYDRTRAERRLDLTEDIGDVVGVDPERTVVPFADPAVAGLERSLAARAFATLPERWQAVLWHLEVEGDSPADVAPLFGLTPNAVSALGYRAREGLRQAYLQEHLASDAGSPPRDRRHRETSERLGAYTRGGLSRRDAGRVEAHLAECDECRALAAELREVNSGLVRSAVGPTVLGAALVGYLATRGGGTGELFASSAFPTTDELAVAAGGAMGVLGALGGVLRPDLSHRGARGVVLAVGAVGLGAAGVAAVAVLGPAILGPGGAPPGADAPSTAALPPGPLLPGSVPPGSSPVLPGPVLPGPALPAPDPGASSGATGVTASDRRSTPEASAGSAASRRGGDGRHSSGTTATRSGSADHGRHRTERSSSVTVRVPSGTSSSTNSSSSSTTSTRSSSSSSTTSTGSSSTVTRSGAGRAGVRLIRLVPLTASAPR